MTKHSFSYVIASPAGAWQSQSRMSLRGCVASAAISIPLFFAACGEQGTTENITQINQMGMDVVASVDELPECTKDNEGEQAFVKGETSARVCVDEKWFATKESVSDTVVIAGGKDTVLVSSIDTIVVAGDTVLVSKTDTLFVENGDMSCTTEPLADSSGLKIVCNGDSIGVVLNGAKGKDGIGKDGSDGKDGAGCSLSQQGQTLFITCGEKTASLKLGEDGGVVVDTAALDSEKVAISLDEVTGVTQKGPFLSGSKVLVREMSDGRTLTQTGNSFNGKILNDKGEFKINARMLVSQYVMLEATGYYRNEVTGDNSNSELTLFAITDVTDRNIVNVNLLTHLEYERVVYLVTKKKMRVKAAKKQAQQEVFGLLGIDASDFSNSEDLNIAGSSDEDGALLAFSVMFQGNRTVAQLTELLTQIATDMEEDGVWSDSRTKKDLAKWSANADLSGKLEQIRQNVADWKLSTKVPNFEQYVRHFWYEEFGLGECSSDSVGVVKEADDGMTEADKRYICEEIGENAGDYRWVVSDDIRKDIYGWNDSTDGALRKGNVTETKYVFDSTGSYNGTKGWRPAVAVENLYGGCVDSLFTKIRSYRGTYETNYYQCQETAHNWVLLNSSNYQMIDTQGWTNGTDGDTKLGDSIGVVSGGSRICYVYDTSAAYHGWRTGNSMDCSMDLGGCTVGLAGMLKLSKASDVYYLCDANTWKQASAQEELACRNEGICRICADGMQGYTENRNGVMYVCDSRAWRQFNCAEKKKGLCTTNDNSIVEACETVGNVKIDYVCSDNKWHAVQHPFEYTLAQWDSKKAEYYTAAKHPNAVYAEDFTDTRDGNTYKTVIINKMRVFAENLRYADSITNVNLKGQTKCYDFKEKNCSIGGRYYTWTAALDLNSQWQRNNAASLIGKPHQGICPDGWHIPTGEEWKAILASVESAAQQMNGFSGWTAATDDKGFSAIPTGFYNYSSYSSTYFFYTGENAYFWSSTEANTGSASVWKVSTNGTSLDNGSKQTAYPVRCIETYENWMDLKANVLLNTMGWACKDTNDGEMKLGQESTNTYFVCDNSAWREATTAEELACRNEGECNVCTVYGQGRFKTKDDKEYVCDAQQWREANCAEIETRSLCSTNDSSLVEKCENNGKFEIDYVCSGNKWHAVQSPYDYKLDDWVRKFDAYNSAALQTALHSDSLITDARDGNQYRTVVINGKRVFAENLRYADSTTNMNLRGQTGCFNNDKRNCAIGGLYYSWMAAMDLDIKWQNTDASSLIKIPHQGICPDGWHIPDDAEWRELFSGVSAAAQMMTGFNAYGWDSASDASGFSAIPVGYFESENLFPYTITKINFWSTKEYTSYIGCAYYWDLYGVNSSGDTSCFYKRWKNSVRCIMDEPQE